jgi:hemolysin activation/secretion protein
LSSAITASGGSSVGALPVQRNWFLGGTHSIRGQSPDTAQHGTAFWRARAEFGTLVQGARPVVFGDLGWVGDRNAMREVGRPMSGVGVGASYMDGLIRLDISRGIYPRKQWRVDFYLESLF